MFTYRNAGLMLAGICLAFSSPLGSKTASAASVSEIVTGTQSYFVQTIQHAGKIWNSVVESVLVWTPGLPSAGDLMGQMDSRQAISETDFANMMDIAGYSIKSVKVEVGVIPHTVFEFAQRREISEYDRQYIQRLLRKQRRERNGPLAMVEREIVETVIEIQSLEYYELTHVVVKLLPLPSISFTAEPKDLVLDPGMSYVVEQINQLNERLQVIADR